ncbi:MAG TPA: hypothetical protein VH206_23435 [Xanthobacteraceae bacterium]|jgi:hypothetical protein|nr:hypothetical protein [Xanthobacteraceae bacterium]
MKRVILAALMLVALVGLKPQAAHAADVPCSNTFINMLAHGQDCRLWWGGLGIGIGTTVASYYATKKHGFPAHRPMTIGAAYGLTTFGCAVATPFVGTFLLNRPLTPREMYTGVADCVIPFIGGYIVDNYLLKHDAWTDGVPEKKMAHK